MTTAKPESERQSEQRGQGSLAKLFETSRR
jgi:hypothetical protein